MKKRKTTYASSISDKSDIDDESGFKGGHPGEGLSDETEEYLTDDPSEESCPQEVSDCKNDDTEQSSMPSGEPVEETSCESVCPPYSDGDANDSRWQPESDPVNSSEKKRPLDVAEGAQLQVYGVQKKLKQEQSLKPTSDAGSDPQDGSSGKRRRSRWDPEPEGNDKADEGDRTTKRRKTRWDGDDAQLKILGPIQLPDFTKESPVGSDNVEIRELKRKLLEINKKLQDSEVHDDRPEGERSPSPQSVYNKLGIRINSWNLRLRQRLIHHRQHIISRLIQKHPTFKPPTDYKPSKLCKKLYIPVREYPGYNFVGLIIGPRGNTQKRMEQETGARISLRGKGCLKDAKSQQKPDTSDNDELHVLVEANNQKSLDAAVAMVEKLLIPVNNGNELKRTQLKELAELNGTCRVGNSCIVCGDPGHKRYACPNLKQTLQSDISCDTCGCSGHPTANCVLTAPVIGSKHDYQYHRVVGDLRDGKSLSFGISSGSGSLPGGCSNSVLSSSLSYGSEYSGPSSTPSTQSKFNKEINNSNLYVGFLPQSLNENRLRELFSPFGRLSEVKIIRDRNTGVSKCYGFVKYDDPVSAATAVSHMHGHTIDGKMLAVRVAGHPTAGSSVSLLPKYPGCAEVYQDSSSQTAWPGPPGSMLQEPQSSFSKCEVSGLPSSSILLKASHAVPKRVSLDLDHSCIFLGSAGSFNKCFPSSYNLPYQIPISSPISFTQFPGNPNHVASHQYFSTPPCNPLQQLHIPLPQGSILTPVPFTTSCPPLRKNYSVKSGYEPFTSDATW